MSKNVLIVIDELYTLIESNKIRFKDYEIERLNKKIEIIEGYLKKCKH